MENKIQIKGYLVVQKRSIEVNKTGIFRVFFNTIHIKNHILEFNWNRVAAWK